MIINNLLLLPRNIIAKTKGMMDGDWNFCQQRLIEVSRTFSQPIKILPNNLEKAVTCGYLLCRVVDTIEDHSKLSLSYRDELYALFIAVVENSETPESFVRHFQKVVRDEGSAFELCRELPRVMQVFRRLPTTHQSVCEKWIKEMACGMAMESHRLPGEDGVVALDTMTDLKRYCYFVAGTVGHMLTGLFLHETEDLSPKQRKILTSNAESFGFGLQLVNILKDISEDLQREISYIPRDIIVAEGLTFSILVDPDHRESAHRALVPIFEKAHECLASAFDYCLALPPSHRKIRLFCLLPLWMAIRTLIKARGNDILFVAGKKVKISRDEVQSLIKDCTYRCGDDTLLIEGFEKLLSH